MQRHMTTNTIANINEKSRTNDAPMTEVIQQVDLLGVGIGPFNLSLAALLDNNKHISSVFFDSKSQFDWHPGLMLEDCTLQVPMMADLVTMVDPTNQYSHLNYLHKNQRLYHFYFYENFLTPRMDYNSYCQWVCQQLPNLQFSREVTQIIEEHHKGQSGYCVTVLNRQTQKTEHYHAKHIVLGMGSTPYWPESLAHLKQYQDVIHSADYLSHKEQLLQLKKGQSITVMGSGQSTGEIVLDLLDQQNQQNYEINWLTRSHGFLPMEYSKLGLEHFSPDYIDYFHQLPERTRDSIRQQQDLWYKGLSQATIAEIYDRIYKRSIHSSDLAPLTMQARSELSHVDINHSVEMSPPLHLHCHHLDQN